MDGGVPRQRNWEKLIEWNARRYPQPPAQGPELTVEIAVARLLQEFFPSQRERLVKDILSYMRQKLMTAGSWGYNIERLQPDAILELAQTLDRTRRASGKPTMDNDFE